MSSHVQYFFLLFPLVLLKFSLPFTELINLMTMKKRKPKAVVYCFCRNEVYTLK